MLNNLYRCFDFLLSLYSIKSPASVSGKWRLMFLSNFFFDIFSDHSKFLGFEWTFLYGKVRFFQFLILALEFNYSLLHVYKIIMSISRKMEKHWYKICYLNGGINGHSSYQLCIAATETLLHDLSQEVLRRVVL